MRYDIGGNRYNMRKIFFDTETTGLSPGNIAQLALIQDTDGIIEARNYFFKVDYITQGAEELCGRGIDFYKEASGGKEFKDYKDELYSIFNGALLIAHNLKFDENFLCTEFWRQGILFKPESRLCTMEYFKPILKLPGKGQYQYKNPKLSELVDYFKIDTEKINVYTKQLFSTDENESFHDARYDTASMFVVFQIYKEMLDQTSLGNSTVNGDWYKTFTQS